MEQLFEFIKNKDIESFKSKYDSTYKNITNKDGFTLLEYAYLYGNIDFVKFLFQNFFEFDFYFKGESSFELDPVLEVLFKDTEKNEISMYLLDNFVDTDFTFDDYRLMFRRVSKNDENKNLLNLLMLQDTLNLEMIDYLLEEDLDFFSEDSRLLDQLIENKLLNDEDKSNIIYTLKRHNFKFNYTRFFSSSYAYQCILINGEYKFFVSLLELQSSVSENDKERIYTYLNAAPDSGKHLSEEEITLIEDVNNKYNLNLKLPSYFKNMNTYLQALEVKAISELEKELFIFDVVADKDLSFDEMTNIIDNYYDKGGSFDLTYEIDEKFNILSYVACFKDNLSIVKYILDKHISVQVGNVSALGQAIWFGKIEAVELFLEYELNPFYVNNNGEFYLSKLGSVTTTGRVVDDYLSFDCVELVLDSLEDETKRRLAEYKFDLRLVNANYEEAVVNTSLVEYFTNSVLECSEEAIEYFSSFLTVRKNNNSINSNDLVDKPKIFDESAELSYRAKENYILNEKNINKKFIGDYHEFPTTILRELIWEGDDEDNVKLVRLMLDNFEDLDYFSYDGTPLVMYAIEKFFPLDIIKKMLEKLDDINVEFEHNIYSDFPDVMTTLSTVLATGFGFFYTLTKEATKEEKLDYRFEVFKLVLDLGGKTDVIVNFYPNSNNRGVSKVEYSYLELVSTYCMNNNDYRSLRYLLNTDYDVTVRVDGFNERIEHFLTTRIGLDKQSSLDAINVFDLLKELRPNEIDLEITQSTNATPLLGAVQHAKYELVRWLIDEGVKLDTIGGHDNGTALSRTISVWPDIELENRLITLELLLDAGLDINITDYNGITVLMEAARNGLPTIVEFLLNRGADINQVDNKGLNALDYALSPVSNYNDKSSEPSEKIQIEIVKILLERGINTDNLNFTYLIYYNYRELLNLFISKGFDVNKLDKNGNVPVHYACHSLEYLKYLKSLNVFDFSKLDSYKQNILNFYFSQINDNYFVESNGKETVDYIINDLGVSFNEFDGYNDMYYAILGKVEMLKVLLDYGLDVNKTTDNGLTPLVGAVYIDADDFIQLDAEVQIEIVTLLFEYGADINATYGGKNIKELVKYTENDVFIRFVEELYDNGGIF